MLYNYKATVTRIIDGDTFVCDLDLGFNLTLKDTTIRLLNYNAPESKGKEKVFGKIATNKLTSLIGSQEVIIKTEKSDVFGRYLGQVWLLNGTNINELLVSEGFGYAWNGKGQRPTFDMAASYPFRT